MAQPNDTAGTDLPESHAPKPPIPNSYWLPGGMVAAGEYPGASFDSAARERLGLLLDAGIRSFVDLTEPRDPLMPYEQLLSVAGEERGLAVRYRRFGIRDMGVTDNATMTSILDYIDGEVSAGRRTYIHCWGGVGRTGTTVGCYLVRHGLSVDEALAMVARLFSTMTEGKTRRFPEGSPQTDAQRAMVRGWVAGSGE